jgi:hypothetical protein
MSNQKVSKASLAAIAAGAPTVDLSKARFSWVSLIMNNSSLTASLANQLPDVADISPETITGAVRAVNASCQNPLRRRHCSDNVALSQS